MTKTNVDAAKTALEGADREFQWDLVAPELKLAAIQARREITAKVKASKMTWAHRTMRVVVFGLTVGVAHLAVEENRHVLPVATTVACQAPRTTVELLYRNVPGTRAFDIATACNR